MKETFGRRLSRFRKAKGLTQEDVAKQITISPQAVSKWENDISTPDILELSTLADILGVSVNELLGREENKKEVAEEIIDTPLQEESSNNSSTEDEDERKIKEGIKALKRKHQKEHRPIDTITAIIKGVLMLCALIAYLLVGFFWKEGNLGWAWGWVFFLVAVVIGSIFDAIKEKKMCKFVYPVLIVAIYVTLGMFGQHFGFNGWHPFWFLFITIPIYYVIAGPVDKAIHRNDTVDKDEDDEEDEEDD